MRQALVSYRRWGMGLFHVIPSASHSPVTNSSEGAHLRCRNSFINSVAYLIPFSSLDEIDIMVG